MMQIVQELCKRPGLNKCGFDMPTIYIPNPNKVRDLLLQLFLTEQARPCVPSVLCFCLSTAKPLREPNRRGVPRSWEDYQPNGPEYTELPGEGLWAYQRCSHGDTCQWQVNLLSLLEWWKKNKKNTVLIYSSSWTHGFCN